jgi:hypothetical protein
MCEYSGRLIAWLDHELPDEEATNVEWHVGQCAECRGAVGAYEEISSAFLACYKAACCQTAKPTPPRRGKQVWTWGGVAAAAAIVAIVLLVQPRTERLSLSLPSPPHAPAIAFEKVVPSAPVVTIQSRHATVAAPIHAQWTADEPMVQVALPADALFPPGAVPEGFSFIADVRFQQ